MELKRLNWITSLIIVMGIAIIPAFFVGGEKRRQTYSGYNRRREITELHHSYIPAALVLDIVVGIAFGALSIFTIVPLKISVAIAAFLFSVMLNAIFITDNEKQFGAAVLVFIVLAVPACGIVMFADVNNAADFDGMITITDAPLFENEIPDSMVRLVTEEYASFIVRRDALGTFGSNREIAATSIVLREGRLTWVCVVVSTNTFAENYVQGMVAVDANNASVVDIINAEDLDFNLAEGLFWTSNIQFANVLNDASYAYSDAYPTWDDEDNLVYVQTRTHVDFPLTERPVGPIIYYQGERPQVYDYIDEVPDWLPRAYSEDWLERQIDRWGAARRGNGFDFWAGGFLGIPPSSDRLEMSEDVRYILNPDTMVLDAMVVANPKLAELTCAGVFRGTKDEIFYHDMSGLGFVAGQDAIDHIVGSIDKPSQGYYDGAMPLLYPIEINNETVWTWYCPIYFYQTEYSADDARGDITNIKLHALAMIDASESRTFYVQETEGKYLGESLVATAKVGFKAKFGDYSGDPPDTTDNTTIIVSDVLEKGEYTINGNTHFLLETNDTLIQYIEGRSDMMDFMDWYNLSLIDVGDVFQATIQLGTDGRWWITEFKIVT
jgi:hypothetical protein